MIIDFHTHVFPDKIAQRTVSALSASANIPPHSDGTLSGLLASMERAGVDIAVNLPVLTSPAQLESVNGYAGKINSRFTSGGVISFAGVHPDMENIPENIRKIREAGFLGIKIHPEYQDCFIDDDRYYEILKAAKSEGLICVTHAGVDGAFRSRPTRCTPSRVKKMLARLGGYDRLVLAHLGACEMYGEVYESLAGEDVYFDTAYVLSDMDALTFKKILAKHGADRILFATDSPWQDQSREIARLRGFCLDSSDEEKIFSLNAKRLLGIE